MMRNSLMTLPMLRRQRGMTLIELMTVIVVLAILASIAVPSYRRYMVRAQRTDAMTALLQLQTAQEKFYLQNNAYANNVTALGTPATSAQGFYDISITPGTGNQSYTATAAPNSSKGQRDDKDCRSLTLTDTGVKGVSSDAKLTAANCWK